jgi:predicted AlkP superfamily pyrophosphatase or phosphodiesterase
VAPAPVVLVSLDAFRWDFMAKTETPNLDALAARGVQAERLIPVFPTKTFPNHYSIATGLYAEHHGIVANNMFDPVFDARFSLSDRSAVTDGRWWDGEPIWVTAERQGQVAAAFFFPGTEAAIHGVRPTYWRDYDGGVPNEDRVAQVLQWLDLPPAERPSLITTYFVDVDDATHRYGTDAPETLAAIRTVDRMIGLLVSGLEQRGIAASTNLVVVSDHGMANTASDRVIFLDDYLRLDEVDVVDVNPVAAIRPLTPGDEDRIYGLLATAHPHLRVYKRDEIPARWHYRDHRRIQPVLAVADEGWSISSHPYVDSQPERMDGANHGYDNALLSMGAVFVAAGPAFREGVIAAPFEAIHVYALLCRILGLTPAPNDGNLDAVIGMLR